MFLAAAVLSPLALLALMLGMERVERPLKSVEGSGADIEGFLDTASQDEVDTFVSQGFAAALERYTKRRGRSNPGRHRAA